MSHWRDRARPIIAAVLAQNLQPGDERKALHEAYPFGERKMWPYKIWCNEIRRQKTGRDIPVELRKKRNRPTGREMSIAERKLREWEAIYGRRVES